MKNHSVSSMDTIRYSNYRGVDKLLALWQYKGIQANFKTCKSFKPKTSHHTTMLLTQLIDQQHNLYAGIQAQIEVLQEEQRRIQAFIQQLGSVDSQMVAALQLLEDAIASIRLVCPDQLLEYKQSVTDLFGDRLSLRGSQPETKTETETETEPETEPGSSTETVEVEVKVETQPETETKTETEPGSSSETIEVEVKVETQPETETEPEIITTMFYGWKGGSHDHIAWRVRDNVSVTVLLKQLRITPKQIKVNEADLFGDGEDSCEAIVTQLGFEKLIEHGDITIGVDEP
jgi:hypothetical protein